MKFQMNFKGIFLLIAILLLASLTVAENITKQYTFSPDTPASSAQVNANFDALYNKINELSAKVATLESSTANIDAMSQRITALESGTAGKLPPADYDSGWFAVDIINTYVKPIGFIGLPKMVTAYYKLQNGEILVWGLNHYGDGLQVNGIILDFDGNGNLYVRTPDTYVGSNGSSYEPALVKPYSYRNRTNNGTEVISTSTGVQFRVLVWK